MSNSIVARLGIDVKDIKKDMANAERDVAAGARKMGASAGAAFSSTMKSGFGALASAVSIGALMQMGRQVIDLAGNLRDTSDALGMSTDSLQELQYAFGQSGASAEVFKKAMSKLSENLTGARNKDEKLIAAFGALGVTFDELQRLSPDQILMRIAASADKTADPAERLARLTVVLGKGGVVMAAGLNSGAESIAALRAETSKLSEEEINKLEAAGDAITTWKNKATVAFGEALTGLEKLVSSGVWNTFVKAMLDDSPGKPLGGIVRKIAGIAPSEVPRQSVNAAHMWERNLASLRYMPEDPKPAKTRVNDNMRDEIARTAEAFSAAFIGDMQNVAALADSEGDAEEEKRGFIEKTTALRQKTIGEIRAEVAKDEAAARAAHTSRMNEIDAERLARKNAFIENEIGGPDARRDAAREQRARDAAGRKFNRQEKRKPVFGPELPLHLKLQPDGLGGKLPKLGGIMEGALPNPAGAFMPPPAPPDLKSDLGGKLDQVVGKLDTIITNGIPMKPKNL